MKSQDWQEALRIWLQHHPKTIPDNLRDLRERFVKRFPTESLGGMALDEYAVGKPDSFCYWLEFKTKELGSISGGSAAKFGVWWSKSEDRWRWNSFYRNAEDALKHIKRGLLAQINATQTQQFESLDKIGRVLLGPNRYSLRGKPLYLYFPEYFLPISNPEHLVHFLNQFGKHPEGDLITLNRQLHSFLHSLPQFEGFDNHQMMYFLYDTIPPNKGDIASIEAPQSKQTASAVPLISNRTKVFISYSRENKDELDRLLVHLRAARQYNAIEWWDDTQIKPGEQWHEEIKKAIASTRIAVLLVSVDYLASDFIIKNELPPLLGASEEEGITILPGILGPCGFKHTGLARFQAVNDPSTPLSRMNKNEKDEIWNKVVETILNPENS